MKADEINTEQAQELEDRTMLERIYSAMVTAEPTALNPHPLPGLLEQVEGIVAEQAHVSAELADHRREVSAKLAEDQSHVKALLEQHAEADAANFAVIRDALAELKPTNGDGTG